MRLRCACIITLVAVVKAVAERLEIPVCAILPFLLPLSPPLTPPHPLSVPGDLFVPVLTS